MNYVVVDLGYGDSGKGTTVDYLARKTGSLATARYNGGSQAAHHVVTSGGLVHCFSQFGSGSLVFGNETFLSRYVIVDPLAIFSEAEELCRKGVNEPLSRLKVSPRALVATPFHKHINQMLEVCRGVKRYGSCGKGVGQAAKDSEWMGELALHVEDLPNLSATRTKLDFLWRQKRDVAEQLLAENPDIGFLETTFALLSRLDYVDRLVEEYGRFSKLVNMQDDEAWVLSRVNETVIWEGAQGALLDPVYGFRPYITKTRTTYENVRALVPEREKYEVLGVMRGYSTRHGRGPFVTYSEALSRELPELHNRHNPWQEDFRAGWLDLVSTKYAIAMNGGVDGLVVTNLDRLFGLPKVKVCVGYRYSGENLDRGRTLHMDFPPTLPMEKLATSLFECLPEYVEFDGWTSSGIEEERFLGFIEEQLGIPILITSYGPTARDKVIRNPV